MKDTGDRGDGRKRSRSPQEEDPNQRIKRLRWSHSYSPPASSIELPNISPENLDAELHREQLEIARLRRLAEMEERDKLHEMVPDDNDNGSLMSFSHYESDEEIEIIVKSSAQEHKMEAEGSTTQERKMEAERIREEVNTQIEFHEGLQRELAMANRSIERFMDHEVTSSIVLREALKALNINEEFVRETIGDMRDIANIAYRQDIHKLQDSIDCVSDFNEMMQELEEELSKPENKVALKRRKKLNNELQKEMETTYDHLSKFMSYIRNSENTMNEVLDTVGMDREAYGPTAEGVRSIIDTNFSEQSIQAMEDSVERLQVVNAVFQAIENEMQKAFLRTGNRSEGKKKLD